LITINIIEKVLLCTSKGNADNLQVKWANASYLAGVKLKE